MKRRIKIITIISGIILILDFIRMMSGASLTTIGLITGFINFIICAAGCDYLGI